jgi:anti-sigma factor RsiW
MFGSNRNEKGGLKQCAAMESRLVEYLDGRALPADRRAVEAHLSACAACSTRAEEFRAVWNALDDLPEIFPSPAFDASLRARISAEPARRGFWEWVPTPRLAFAITSLVILSAWISSAPRVIKSPTVISRAIQESKVSAEKDFGMIRDLPELENFDVISKFDALTELPIPPTASTQEPQKEIR